jgi:GWxTD domain-containing protein
MKLRKKSNLWAGEKRGRKNVSPWRSPVEDATIRNMTMTEKIRGLTRLPGFILILALAQPGFAAAQNPVKEQDLLLRHREWLKLTSTFILPAERDVFLTLLTERDRDMFMEAFWKQRDPTPETAVNEYKEEMERRFKYVKETFGRETTREAWQTDQGRIYMILGPPKGRDNFEGTSGLQPAMVWHYYGDPLKKLPRVFDLIFYRRGGGGEFKLYDPGSDGPASLLVDTRQLDLTNASEVYNKIRDLAPSLAQASLSVIPNQIPYNYRPTTQNTMILADIFESAKKNVNTSYAAHFQNYRGIVSAEYLPNYIENDATLSIVYDGVRDLNFLHFSILPRRASIDYDEPKDQYYCNFKLSVTLRRGEEVVFQYSRDYPFSFSSDLVENIKTNGIAVQDLLPVAEGKFKLTVLLQNTVGKEFSLFEKNIEVPAGVGPVRMAEPVVGFGFQDTPAADFVPYKFLGRQILTDPRGTINAADKLAFALEIVRLPRELWTGGTVEIATVGSQSEGKSVPVRTIKLSDLPYTPTMTIVDEVSASNLQPEYYELTFTLKNAAGEILGTTAANFILSPAAVVPHAVSINNAMPEEKAFLYYYGVAVQYAQVGDPGKAEEAFRKARDLKPDYKEGIIQYADFLARAGKPAEALEMIEPFASSENYRFDYFRIKGTALKEKGEYDAAIQSLLEAYKIYNSDTRLLNALGFCFYKTGRRAEALNALSVSLRLDPGQNEVRDLLDRVEKELKENSRPGLY